LPRRLCDGANVPFEELAFANVGDPAGCPTRSVSQVIAAVDASCRRLSLTLQTFDQA
jgi:uncharacterized Zn-binding protein involved in type VI secretion